MHPFIDKIRGRILLTVLGVSGAVVLSGAVIYFFYCPCQVIPGGWLLGSEVTEPISDWSFANKVPLCQIQVGEWLPHSVNLNCMSSGGKLYLSCGNCDGKRWSTMALADPNGRIRVSGSVYPVTLTRVAEPELLDEAWRARAAKVGRPSTRPRPPGWWSFSVTSR